MFEVHLPSSSLGSLYNHRILCSLGEVNSRNSENYLQTKLSKNKLNHYLNIPSTSSLIPVKANYNNVKNELNRTRLKLFTTPLMSKLFSLTGDGDLISFNINQIKVVRFKLCKQQNDKHSKAFFHQETYCIQSHQSYPHSHFLNHREQFEVYSALPDNVPHHRYS